MTDIFIKKINREGIAGSLAKCGDNTHIAEPIGLNDSKKPASFGDPMKIVNGLGEKLEAGDTAANFKGILMLYKGQTPIAPNDYTTPDARYQHTILRKDGYLHVKCAIGEPTLGCDVYINPTTNTFEATADSPNNFIVPNLEWNLNGKDAENVSVIFVK